MKRKRGFTLIELLVVLSIISMLAAQLMPALSTAREKGRQANCMNNFHQFAVAFEIYQNDYSGYNSYPPWLSCLYPGYVKPATIFVCLSDSDRGAVGHGNTGYMDSADIPVVNMTPQPPDPADPGFTMRNAEVTKCSYSYEFNANKCWWFAAAYAVGSAEFKAADTDGNGTVSWKEAKLWQAKAKYKGQVPIVRCFWHNYNHGLKVMNLAFRDGNVYLSPLRWEDEYQP